MRMTDVGIRKLKSKSDRYEQWEDGRTSLGIRISAKGKKTFVYMYWLNGKARRMTLGTYGDGPNHLTLADANVKHAEARKALDEGQDAASETVETRKAEREAETVTNLVETFLAKWARPRKCSAAEDERILNKKMIPHWRIRIAKDVKRRDIIALLDDIVDRGAPIQANRTMACVRRMFSWAIGRYMLDTSPCARIKAPAPENRSDRAMSDDEIATFWHGLDEAKMTDTLRLPSSSSRRRLNAGARLLVPSGVSTTAMTGYGPSPRARPRMVPNTLCPCRHWPSICSTPSRQMLRARLTYSSHRVPTNRSAGRPWIMHYAITSTASAFPTSCPTT